MSAQNPVCMPSIDGNDYTLCGVAYEAFESGDSEEPVTVGKPGQHITCERCLHVIAECKAIKGGRVPQQSGR